jgi:DNA-binding MarR family transcriptional regulator
VDDFADLSLAVRQVTLAVQRYRLRAARAGFDMGATEMMVLSQLFTEGPCTPTSLAEFLSMTTASVTALLDRLERAGHVVRRPHPTDRRMLLIELNPDARATITAMFTYTGQATASAAHRLSGTELAAVTRFLHDLVDAYDRIDPLAGLQDAPPVGDERSSDAASSRAGAVTA